MDTQGRGGVDGLDDIDPADQWVFNPETGGYELNLSGVPTSRAAVPAVRPRPRPASGTASSTKTLPPRPRRSSDDAGATGRGAGTRTRDRRPPGAGGPPRGRGTERRAAAERRRAKKERRRKILIWVSACLAMLMLIGAGVAWYVYKRLNDNLTKVEVPFDNPVTRDAPVNILFIGTDERLGAGNDGYGDADSTGHADTTVLLHVSQDRTHATALSIPRDLVVDIPDCETVQSDGSVRTIPGAQRVRFNESYGVDGRDPGCTWKTVEQLVGVEINHFMMADFNAVKDLSTAVGGVEVCLAKDIDDKKSHLTLPAGRHVVEGEQALAFVRTRSSVGFGSDLSRIELQQQFLASMARSLTSGDTLTNPTKVWALAEAVTNSLTVDAAIGDIQSLVALAQDLADVPVKDISFVTVPVIDNPDEEVAATVVLNEDKALPLFRMLQEDLSLTEAEEAGKAAEDSREAVDAREKAEPVPAAQVRVDVYNGGTRVGAAQDTLVWMQNTHGMVLATNAGNATAQQTTTTLEYGPDQAGQAATLAELMGLPDSALKESSADAGDSPMTLVLGDDFRGAGTPIEVEAKKPADLDSVTADDEDVCAS
ncbi:LCP family glycopolymer transferase [Streptomyces calidiresistens]|uniref:LytR family transcriptional regulator n=1 Tax=Streptomyces calidiresistens TaxID=1485586 RepID=A0A7W3T186_9ACTN|nr:LytR family transcriptional regulator [Streptomyces calidiresistens]